MWVSGTSINPLTVWETNSAINQNVAIRFTYSLCPRTLPRPPPPSTCSPAAGLTSLPQPGPAQPCLVGVQKGKQRTHGKAETTGYHRAARKSLSFSTQKAALWPEVHSSARPRPGLLLQWNTATLLSPTLHCLFVCQRLRTSCYLFSVLVYKTKACLFFKSDLAQPCLL